MSDPANTKIYRNVLVGLLIGTILTVWIAGVHMGRPMNLTVGILIAIVKASLVLFFFMHMKYEKRIWLGIVLFPIALVMIIIFSNFPDTALNDENLVPAAQKVVVPGAGGAAH